MCFGVGGDQKRIPGECKCPNLWKVNSNFGFYISLDIWPAA
jgi:hypothetical protein